MTHATLTAHRVHDAAKLVLEELENRELSRPGSTDFDMRNRVRALAGLAAAARQEPDHGLSLTVSVEDFGLIEARYGEEWPKREAKLPPDPVESTTDL